MKKLTIAAFLLLFINLSAQQNTVHRCGYDHYVEQLNIQYPGFYDNFNTGFQIAKNFGTQMPGSKSINSEWDTVYRIPVVFHVVYNTTAQNISDELLLSQIDVLNEDFRRRNSDTSETRAIFKERAGDAGIEFFLATLAPDGNITNGITRTQTTNTNFGSGFFPDPSSIDNGIKKTAGGGIDPWPTDKYLNIWIGNLGESLLGYAYPPLIAPNWPANATPIDTSVRGVVINHRVIGFENPLAVADADKGRTATHEIGHYLGLRHVWGDGPLSLFLVDCSADDGIDDTPNSGNNSQGSCLATKNTCPDDPEPDMWENYMDYSKEECQNIFTQGQVTVMRSMVALGRPELAKIIKDEILILSAGDYIVINGTDTFVIGTDIFTINTGDEVMFLNENNGFNYTATNTFTVSGPGSVYATKAGNVSNINTSLTATNRQLAEISLVPNPANSKFSVQGIENTNINNLQIFDISGKLLKKATVSATSNSVSTENLKSGIYLINFFDNELPKGTKKLIVY